MDYGVVAQAYSRIEATPKRLEMTAHFVELLRNTDPSLVGRLVYLTQGKVLPDFRGLELGIAAKLALRALAFATGVNETEAETLYQETGDIGLVAERMVGKKKQTALFSEKLTLERVYKNFMDIAGAAGRRSQDLKSKLTADLLHDATPSEARYIMRSLVGTLRLGMADMTIVDSLAEAFAKKEERDRVESAYNVSSDLGRVAQVLAQEGIDGLASIRVEVGVPLRPMLCERLSALEEILEKLEGEAALEFKYDGLRIQAHLDGEKIHLFSRQLEDVTSQFPDVIEALGSAVPDGNCILEGECVPINTATGEFLPFQMVSRRRGRVYDIEKAVREFPVVLFLFDCLLHQGKDMTSSSYLERRRTLLLLLIELD